MLISLHSYHIHSRSPTDYCIRGSAWCQSLLRFSDLITKFITRSSFHHDMHVHCLSQMAYDSSLLYCQGASLVHASCPVFMLPPSARSLRLPISCPPASTQSAALLCGVRRSTIWRCRSTLGQSNWRRSCARGRRWRRSRPWPSSSLPRRSATTLRARARSLLLCSSCGTGP